MSELENPLFARLSVSHKKLESRRATSPMSAAECDLDRSHESLGARLREHLRIVAIVAGSAAPWFTNLGISPTEQQILWLLILAQRCAAVHKALDQARPPGTSVLTVATVRRVVYPAPADVWSELGPRGTLRRLGLVEGPTPTRVELGRGKSVLDSQPCQAPRKLTPSRH